MITRLISSNEKSAVEQLRFQTLSANNRFTAEIDAVKWSTDDEVAKVYGTFSDSGELVSSLRAEILVTPESLVPKLDYEFLDSSVRFPCGLLGKAATLSEYSRQGLISHLLLEAHRDFHRTGIEHVVITVMPAALTNGLFQSMGYQFIENKAGWRRYGYQSFGPTYVGHLDLTQNFERLQSVLVERAFVCS